MAMIHSRTHPASEWTARKKNSFRRVSNQVHKTIQSYSSHILVLSLNEWNSRRRTSLRAHLNASNGRSRMRSVENLPSSERWRRAEIRQTFPRLPTASPSFDTFSTRLNFNSNSLLSRGKVIDLSPTYNIYIYFYNFKSSFRRTIDRLLMISQHVFFPLELFRCVPPLFFHRSSKIWANISFAQVTHRLTNHSLTHSPYAVRRIPSQEKKT